MDVVPLCKETNKHKQGLNQTSCCAKTFCVQTGVQSEKNVRQGAINISMTESLMLLSLCMHLLNMLWDEIKSCFEDANAFL